MHVRYSAQYTYRSSHRPLGQVVLHEELLLRDKGDHGSVDDRSAVGSLVAPVGRCSRWMGMCIGFYMRTQLGKTENNQQRQ